MAGFCAEPSADLGMVQGLLTSVDCNVQAMSQIGYHAVSGPNSQVALALTSMMTIYVAVLGLRLLLGFAALRVGEVTLTVLKLSLVIALATSWPTYQHVVFDTLFHGPEQLAASMMTAIQPPDSLLRGNPYDGLQIAYDQLQLDAAFFARISQPASSPLAGGAPFAAFSLNSASYLMMLSTLGVVLAAKIVLALLLALGPIFIAFLLFDATRGVFEGWLRASLAFALAPLLATLALIVQLVLVEPHLLSLAEMRQSGEPDLPAATATFLLTLVSTGVSFAGLWGVAVVSLGFRLPWRSGKPAATSAAAGVAPTPVVIPGGVNIAAEGRAAVQPRVAAIAAAAAAADRRDLQIQTVGVSERLNVASRADAQFDPSRRLPLGQTYRRQAQSPRAASSARRDR